MITRLRCFTPQNRVAYVLCGFKVIPGGDELHEDMISVDDAHRTIDIGDRFVIQPEFGWWGNGHLEGAPLPDGFAYTSDRNDTWLDTDGLRALLDHA